jgi:hypothetical protein
MYENKQDPLAPVHKFYKRILYNILLTIFILILSLSIGILGYHFTANIPWLDAMHNASMILSGMGPVVEITTVTGKWFSSFYALFSGIVFITNIGIVLAPAVHRLVHKFNLEE